VSIFVRVDLPVPKRAIKGTYHDFIGIEVTEYLFLLQEIVIPALVTRYFNSISRSIIFWKLGKNTKLE